MAKLKVELCGMTENDTARLIRLAAKAAFARFDYPFDGQVTVTITDTVPLGDMIISVERAKEQAAEFGHGLARECAYLTVHSMLHLVGYDHVDEGEEKAAMRQKEEEILAVLGLTRKE